MTDSKLTPASIVSVFPPLHAGWRFEHVYYCEAHSHHALVVRLCTGTHVFFAVCGSASKRLELELCAIATARDFGLVRRMVPQ